jgi:hypothetical protein
MTSTDVSSATTVETKKLAGSCTTTTTDTIVPYNNEQFARARRLFFAQVAKQLGVALTTARLGDLPNYFNQHKMWRMQEDLDRQLADTSRRLNVINRAQSPFSGTEVQVATSFVALKCRVHKYLEQIEEAWLECELAALVLCVLTRVLIHGSA